MSLDVLGRTLRFASLLCLLWLPSGCVDQIMLDAFIAEIRKMHGSAETMHDFEMAEEISESSIGHLEGIYRLDNDDTDMQSLLTYAWSAHAMRFMFDAMETSQGHDQTARARYHERRIAAAMRRARFFATQWFRDRDDDFDAALGDTARLRAWLADEVDDAEDAPLVLWAGLAWTGEALAARRVDAAMLNAGRMMLEHSRKLDERAVHGLATVLLSLDHAARGEGDAQALAERGIAVSDGKYLPAGLARVVIEACSAPSDTAPPGLDPLAKVSDPLPAARLDNLIASQRARRYRRHWNRFGPCPLPDLRGAASR